MPSATEILCLVVLLMWPRNNAVLEKGLVSLNKIYQSLESQENMLRIQMKKTKEADTETKVQRLTNAIKSLERQTE